MRLTDLLRGARTGGTADRPRRRRAARADAPRTIVPVEGDAAVPSWLVGREHVASEPAPSPFELRLDEARERLRRAIPPVDDEA